MAIAAGRRDSITPKGYACTSRSRGPRDEADGEAHRLRGWGTRGKAEAAGHHRDAAAAATRWGSVLGQANALLGVGRYAEDEGSPRGRGHLRAAGRGAAHRHGHPTAPGASDHQRQSHELDIGQLVCATVRLRDPSRIFNCRAAIPAPGRFVLLDDDGLQHRDRAP
jgi:hypothetical protein